MKRKGMKRYVLENEEERGVAEWGEGRMMREWENEEKGGVRRMRGRELECWGGEIKGNGVRLAHIPANSSYEQSLKFPVQCGVVWCSVVWCGAVKCCEVWCSVVLCGSVFYWEAQYEIPIWNNIS